MTLDGMQQLNDGNWYYMEHGKVSDKANGTLQPVGDEWLYVGRYRVDNSYTGLCANEAGTWYVAKGKYNLIIPVWSVRERTTGRTGTM